jgi:hypothetical protein
VEAWIFVGELGKLRGGWLRWAERREGPATLGVELGDQEFGHGRVESSRLFQTAIAVLDRFRKVGAAIS